MGALFLPKAKLARQFGNGFQNPGKIANKKKNLVVSSFTSSCYSKFSLAIDKLHHMDTT